MEYVEKKGLKISKFTLGTAQLGCDYGIANNTGRPSEHESLEILKSAAEGGINSYDTSSGYELSEEILGKFFNGNSNRLGNPVIITKIFDFDFRSKQTIKQSIFRQVEDSLRKLKLSKIPVLMLHYFSDYEKGGAYVIECLRELKACGKIDKIGISLYAEDNINMILEEDLFEAVQIPLNIFDHRLINSGILSEFKKKDMIVFVRSVYLQGLFFLDSNDLPVNLRSAKDYLVKLHELAKRAGMSVAQLCTSFVKNLDGITSLVIGCETVKQIRENITLIEDSKAISKEIYSEIFDYYANMPQKIINPILWSKS
ncbi:MAG: aldo/keto reductase [Ruminiclostridium sp.]|nr:aldo/keto reductase [Ruminiclostridium sp.]